MENCMILPVVKNNCNSAVPLQVLLWNLGLLNFQLCKWEETKRISGRWGLWSHLRRLLLHLFRFCCPETNHTAPAELQGKLGIDSLCLPRRSKWGWKWDVIRFCSTRLESRCQVLLQRKTTGGVDSAEVGFPVGPLTVLWSPDLSWCGIHFRHTTLGRPLFLLETQIARHLINSSIPFLLQAIRISM